MALQNSDLFYVQRGADGFKMPASALNDYIAGNSGLLNYKGAVDCTVPVGNQLITNPPVVGDIYINTGTGTVDASGSNNTDSWVGITGNAISDGQRVVWDGATWEIVGQESGGGLVSVSGTAPIQVDDSDAANPVISINPATNAAFGSTRLAQDPPNGGDLSSTADTDVLSVPHFNELAGRITTAAGGGVQSVTGTNGLTSSGDTDVTISGVDATVSVKGVTQLTDTVTEDSTKAVTGSGVADYSVPLNLSSLPSLT